MLRKYYSKAGGRIISIEKLTVQSIGRSLACVNSMAVGQSLFKRVFKYSFIAHMANIMAMMKLTRWPMPRQFISPDMFLNCQHDRHHPRAGYFVCIFLINQKIEK